MASPTDPLTGEAAGSSHEPRLYEVERGVKSDSYITAVTNNPIPPYGPGATYAKNPPRATLDESGDIEPVVRLRNKNPDQAGLSEEELEEYREDPFWSRLRCVLFWLFWLLWLLLFLFALIILFFSPKCIAKLTPSWWQSAIAYNVWVPSFADSDGDGSGDIDGLIERLDQLKKAGVQTLWPRPFLLSDDFSDAIRDYNAIDSKLGVNTDAAKLINEAHNRDMKMIIDVPIATTSLEHDWFLRSQAASKPDNKDYAEFYTWSKKDGLDSSFFSKLKDTSYFHKMDEPKAAVLNWKDAHVKMAIFDALSSWIDRGVDGFHLTGIEYMARSPNFTEPDWPAITSFVSDVRTHVETYANESAVEGEEPRKIIIFASMLESKEKDKRALVSDQHLHSLINYELGKVEKNTKICHKNEGNVGLCTYEILADLMLFHNLHDDVIPAWEFGNPFLSRLASRVGSRKHAELLLMVQLMLPGGNAIYYGDEIGMRNLPNDTTVPVQQGAMLWDDSDGAGFSAKPGVPVASDYKNINWKRQYGEEQSILKTFSKLAKLRNRDETLIVGKTLMGRLVDGSAFSMARFRQTEGSSKPTGTIYVIGVNFSPKSTTLPLDMMPNQELLRKVTVVALSSKTQSRHLRENLDLSSKTLDLGPDEGIVFKYPA